jgi:membrane associated rhomboid family serine protease
VVVFEGSPDECTEHGLVLDARGVTYERVLADGTGSLKVAASMAEFARDELRRYAAERFPRREPPHLETYDGGPAGAVLYAMVLILVAYFAGRQSFDVDWFEAGALDARAGGGAEWWRPLTALTLHLDQEHLLGNLLFGVGIGVLAGRMFGPGLAWLSILMTGAIANYLDMLVAPHWHHAVGASTAVFAALGLLAGFGWGREMALSDRRLYRWGPLFAGLSLLALLGAGNEHVDVLGHVLGFLCGIVLGRVYARFGIPQRKGRAWQLTLGGFALVLLAGAWLVALRHSR